MSIPSLLAKARWRVLSSYKVNKLRTHLHQALRPCGHPRIVWVFGCQRSGTTMLRSFIGFDPRVDDQGEGDPPYFWQVPVEDPRYLRAIPDEEIARLAAQSRSEVVLIKPLHDSQRAAALLNRFPDSKGIWIFRHYHEVILSHLNYYRGRYDPLPYVKDLLDLSEGSWKSEGLGESMRDFILTHRHLATTPTAGFALFWLARNSLLFEQLHPRLATLHYADLVEHPRAALAFLSQHVDLRLDPRYAEFPQRRERTSALPDAIPPPLHDACEQMMSRLKAAAVPLGQMAPL
jgi:hypothetical protein